MKHVFYALGFISIVCASAWMADRAGVFLIHDVQVQIQTPAANASFYSAKREKLTTDLSQLKGSQLWRLRIGEISSSLSANDWIADIQIFRRFPDRLEVNITPKAIALVFQSPKGQLFPVASDGSLLAPARSNEVPDVPILKGKVFHENLELRRKAVALLSELPLQGKLTSALVSELTFGEHEGFQLLMHDARIPIQIGHDDFKRKASRVSHVMSYLDSHAIEGRFIDASYARKVLVRVKKNPTPEYSSKQ